MSRRAVIAAAPPPPPVVIDQREAPPAFEPVVVRGTRTARHCFSVCLYHEPTYAASFPGRTFSTRYLQRGAIAEFLARHQAHLVMFVDPAMLAVARQMDVGDIYLVKQPPRFAWEQHVWRYYAALLPSHPTIRAYHFRGLDNVMRDDIAMLERFVDGGYDLLRAPYARGKSQIWTPVRGSCSVAHRGLASLGGWLSTRPMLPATASWPEPFHVDEQYLARWFRANRDELDVFTYVDRPLKGKLYREIQRAFLQRRRVHVEGLVRTDGPMRRGSDH